MDELDEMVDGIVERSAVKIVDHFFLRAAQLVALLTQKFAGERSVAHPGAIGLEYPIYLADLVWSHSQPRAGTGRGGVG